MKETRRSCVRVRGEKQSTDRPHKTCLRHIPPPASVPRIFLLKRLFQMWSLWEFIKTICHFIYLLPFALLQSRFLSRWLQRPGICFYFDTTTRCVAITIDDAPFPGSTESILQVLARHGVKATFFIIGERAAKYPELMHMIVRDGHELANHDRKDRITALCGKEELMRAITTTEDLIKKYQPAGSKWFRPGVGFYSPAVVHVARTLGFRLALADAYPHDVASGHKPLLIDTFFRWRVQPGSIVVLHDGRPSLPTSSNLDRLLTRLHHEGYQVGSLSFVQELALQKH